MRSASVMYRLVVLLLLAPSAQERLAAQTPVLTDPRSGLRLLVVEEFDCPTLRLVLPGEDPHKGGILIVYPEHVTVLEHGKAEVKHIYQWRTDDVEGCEPPEWKQVGQSLEYQMELKDKVKMIARATLEADRVSYHFTLVNNSDVDYNKIEAIWDPRMKDSIFQDLRLERTYVHRNGKFELLASDTPGRLQMPIDKWLQVRYLNSYTWPVPPPEKRIVKDDGGITYINASVKVDMPLIATVSADKAWIAASYSANAGNVWSNPEISCQHANPGAPLKAHGQASLEGGTFVFKGALEDLLAKVH